MPQDPTNSGERTEIVPLLESLPPNLPLIPVTQTTLFPGMVVPLILSSGKLLDNIQPAIEGAGYVGIVMSGYQGKDSEVYPLGVAAKILKKINLPDQQASLIVAGIQRFKIEKLVSREPALVASVTYLAEIIKQGTELEALIRSALIQFKQISKDNPLISEEVKIAVVNIDGPGKLADFMASVLVREAKEYQALLECADVTTRLELLLVMLKKEQDVQTVQRKIQDQINQKVSTSQREFYLQEQLKLIQKELGRYTDERAKIVQKFRDRLKDKVLKPEVKTRIEEEFERIGSLPEQSSEYSVSLNYLDWVTSLPWGIRTEENFDLRKAKEILDRDHYGLKDVKERILEYLAVKKLKKTTEGSIICLVGPPGTGKTSLGRSVASVLNRKFFRFSVGGMRDEAEIKGHRRTYVGALPGRMIQGLKRVGSQNPVFLIDEIDKMGTGWASGGDPASALLELLDPEQNREFMDHYLDIPYDCSEVFFITTANSVDTIPAPLLDRMEIIYLRGYTDLEKFQIARQYLIPKQFKKNAVEKSQLVISDKGLRTILQQYAREAGVRSLEKVMAKICRKVAYRIAKGRTKITAIREQKDVEKFLGKPLFEPETDFKNTVAGVATGLAWTPYGGEVLKIESLAVEGKGGFVLTGTLGKVMQESASIAYTYIRDQMKPMNLSKHYFDRHLFHVHVPSGATPKDGPSAGVTMAASLYSLLTQTPLPHGVAMTGELTLSGRILPVGGIQEKLLAAKRSQIHTVILPSANARDLKEIEPEIKKGLEVIRVSSMDECLKSLFKTRVAKSGRAAVYKQAHELH